MTEKRTPSFHGTGSTLFGIHVTDYLLTLVTLGICACWDRTRVREYLYGHTAFDGDRPACHGTGMELLNGLANREGGMRGEPPACARAGGVDT